MIFKLKNKYLIQYCNIVIFSKAGALTSKPYAFKNRPWELNYINSTDILDSLGSSIRFYLYGSEIKRVLPLKNDIINEDWISNKTRFFFESLYKWRINIPLMRKKKTLIYVSWLQSFFYFSLKIWFYSIFFKSKNLAFILNFIIDYELLITTKLIMNLLGFLNIKNYNLNYLNDFYLFYINPFFFNILKNESIFVFIGINLRLESPILNIKLRKNFLKENLVYSHIGCNFNDNLNSFSLGLNIKNLLFLLKGKLKFNLNLIKIIKHLYNNSKNIVLKTLEKENNVQIFLGNNLLYQKDNKNIYNILIKKINNLNIINNIYNIKEKKNKFIFVKDLKFKYKNLKILKKKESLNISIIFLNLFHILYEEFLLKNTNDLNFLSKDLNILYILNSNLSIKEKKNKFIVYQGHHIDTIFSFVDLIFPNMTFLEKSGLFLNIEGSLLKTNKVLSKPNYSRNDWMILNANYIYLLKFLNKIYNLNLNFNKLKFLNSNRFYININNIKKLYLFLKKYSPNFYFKEISKYNLYNNNLINLIFNKNKILFEKIYNKIIINYYYNIYNLNFLDKNSRTISWSSHYFIKNLRNYINI